MALWNSSHRRVLTMTAVCLVLGVLLGMQAHTQRLRGAMKVGRQTSALVGMLTATQAQLQEQQEEIERLRAQVARYEKEAASEKGLLQLVNEQLRNSRIAVGLVPVKGPGVELVLGDSTMRLGTDVGEQEAFVVHEYDLLHVANELWAAGAEAVSLNGHRLGVGSAIHCSGRLIEVDKVAIASPFTFLALGNKENLMSALNIRGGLLNTLRRLEFQVQLTPKEEIVIPPITIERQYKYAQPVPPEEEK